MNNLQSAREEAIPKIISKYEKLVDNIFEAVGQPLPQFQNVEDEDGEIKVTAEQQLYSFIATRKGAVDTADNIMRKVNDLQRELFDPTWGDKEEESEPQAATSPAKKYSKK